ncbi:MAG: hypothetical protein ACSLFP_13760 [Acidimicrobiales bacterium]
MRKALLAVAVATALFAVGAFAASFTVQSEDIASGSNPVTACATNVDVDFATPEAQSDGTWTVDGATVRFLNASAGSVSTCDNFDARLAVNSGAGYVELGGLAPVDGGEASFSFTPINVAPISGASVVVDGATLTADLLP